VTAAAPEPEVFAALADPTRWEVLRLLATAGDGSATTPAERMPVSRRRRWRRRGTPAWLP
jgi:hypothetical protein